MEEKSGERFAGSLIRRSAGHDDQSATMQMQSVSDWHTANSSGPKTLERQISPAPGVGWSPNFQIETLPGFGSLLPGAIMYAKILQALRRGSIAMMNAMGPDDLPRISIVRRAHPRVANFYRDYWQAFVGHAIPPSKDSDWPPVEEYAYGGWKLGFMVDQLRQAS